MITINDQSNDILETRRACSRTQARTALLGYRRQAFKIVDPDDSDQIDAYLELRRTTRRVLPETFIAYLKKRVKTMRNGEQVSLDFWAVPKTNFPKGLPPKILDACVDEDSEILEGLTLRVDRAKYYVIDKVIDRNQLGKGVWTDVAYLDVGASCAMSGPDAITDREPADVDHTDADAGSDEDDAPLRPATGGGAPGGGGSSAKCRGLDLDVPGAPAVAENPEVKRAKTQLNTLRALRVNITKAADANIWVHKGNSLNPNRVLFWVEQTLLALQELGQDPQGRLRVDAIAVAFRTFMVNFVYSSACYPQWCHFKGVFPRLADLIVGDDIDECRLLENLASTNPDGFEFPKVRKKIKIKKNDNGKRKTKLTKQKDGHIF